MITSAYQSGRKKELLQALLAPRVPARIARRFRAVDSYGHMSFGKLLKSYLQTRSEKQQTASESNLDPRGNFVRRLDNFRQIKIPWLMQTCPLEGAEILEIGCGAGSSTFALAEQGAHVTAIDLDGDKISRAVARFKADGLTARFIHANATEARSRTTGQQFDLILFFATLEHMTQEERIQVMRDTWEMLPPGGLWCLVETPNRLWFFDGHTAWLPFFHWLPDDLAIQYARHSPRKEIRTQFAEVSAQSRLGLSRLGRGLSFHEFALAMDPVEGLDVVSSLPIFLRQKNFLRALLWQLTTESRFEAFLKKVGPRLHPGFYQPSLELIIRKR